MKIRYYIEIDAEVDVEMYPEDINNIAQILQHELKNVDHKFIVQQIVNDNFDLKMGTGENEEETF